MLVSCTVAKNVFGLINKTSVFFSESCKHAALWTDIVSKNKMGTDKLKQLKIWCY